MKSFVFTWRVPPPPDVRLMVRFGSSVCDAYYSSLLARWFMLVPGGNPEKLPAPPMWWCDEEYARTHQRELSSNETPSNSEGEKETDSQLNLFR